MLLLHKVKWLVTIIPISTGNCLMIILKLCNRLIHKKYIAVILKIYILQFNSMFIVYP